MKSNAKAEPKPEKKVVAEVIRKHVDDNYPDRYLSPRVGRTLARRFRGWNEPRATAWRAAQLSLLHSKEFANPYFWAAFTLTGQWN